MGKKWVPGRGWVEVTERKHTEPLVEFGGNFTVGPKTREETVTANRQGNKNIVSSAAKKNVVKTIVSPEDLAAWRKGGTPWLMKNYAKLKQKYGVEPKKLFGSTVYKEEKKRELEEKVIKDITKGNAPTSRRVEYLARTMVNPPKKPVKVVKSSEKVKKAKETKRREIEHKLIKSLEKTIPEQLGTYFRSKHPISLTNEQRDLAEKMKEFGGTPKKAVAKATENVKKKFKPKKETVEKLAKEWQKDIEVTHRLYPSFTPSPPLEKLSKEERVAVLLHPEETNKLIKQVQQEQFAKKKVESEKPENILRQLQSRYIELQKTPGIEPEEKQLKEFFEWTGKHYKELGFSTLRELQLAFVELQYKAKKSGKSIGEYVTSGLAEKELSGRAGKLVLSLTKYRSFEKTPLFEQYTLPYLAYKENIKQRAKTSTTEIVKSGIVEGVREATGLSMTGIGETKVGKIFSTKVTTPPSSIGGTKIDLPVEQDLAKDFGKAVEKSIGFQAMKFGTAVTVQMGAIYMAPKIASKLHPKIKKALEVVEGREKWVKETKGASGFVHKTAHSVEKNVLKGLEKVTNKIRTKYKAEKVVESEIKVGKEGYTVRYETVTDEIPERVAKIMKNVKGKPKKIVGEASYGFGEQLPSGEFPTEGKGFFKGGVEQKVVKGKISETAKMEMYVTGSSEGVRGKFTTGYEYPGFGKLGFSEGEYKPLPSKGILRNVTVRVRQPTLFYDVPESLKPKIFELMKMGGRTGGKYGLELLKLGKKGKTVAGTPFLPETLFLEKPSTMAFVKPSLKNKVLNKQYRLDVTGSRLPMIDFRQGEEKMESLLNIELPTTEFNVSLKETKNKLKTKRLETVYPTNITNVFIREGKSSAFFKPSLIQVPTTRISQSRESLELPSISTETITTGTEMPEIPPTNIIPSPPSIGSPNVKIPPYRMIMGKPVLVKKKVKHRRGWLSRWFRI